MVPVAAPQGSSVLRNQRAGRIDGGPSLELLVVVGFEPILHPFPDVAMYVEQPERIGFQKSYLMGSLAHLLSEPRGRRKFLIGIGSFAPPIAP